MIRPQPNPCHIEIFNLSPANRAILSRYKNAPVCLKAGYKNSIGVIFQGDMIRCTHLKETTSWKTILANGDGALASATKRTNKSYAKGTPIKAIVEDLIKQIGLPSHSLHELKEIDGRLKRNLSLSGSPMSKLTSILSSFNINASIQNQTLQIRRESTPLQKEAIVLSAQSGLVASPEINADGMMTIRSVLMADFLPGRLVSVDSALFKGFAIIKTVRFSGANFGNTWEAEMECKVN